MLETLRKFTLSIDSLNRNLLLSFFAIENCFHWWSNDAVERVKLGLVRHEPSLLRFDWDRSGIPKIHSLKVYNILSIDI